MFPARNLFTFYASTKYTTPYKGALINLLLRKRKIPLREIAMKRMPSPNREGFFLPLKHCLPTRKK